jgi:2-dehydro-3-deoxygluconokinase
VIGTGQPRVVTFGEMLLRLSPRDHPRLFESEGMRAGFGGAEANVAVSLAHFGVRCEYVTRLPANLIGDAAIDVLRGEGVDTSRILRGPERMGLYFVEPGAHVGRSRVVYDRLGSAFAAITPTMLDWPALLAGAVWFHATGITAALGAGPVATLTAAIAAARSHGVPTSIDLNFRPALWGDRDPGPLVRPLIQRIDLLIANSHSVRAMLGVDAADDVLATPDGARGLASELAQRFECREIALTRREVHGANENRWSAMLYHAATGAIVASQTWTVTVVDRIGGGDAFVAALIAARLQGRASADAVEFAVAASALKLGIPGDFNRVTAAEVDQVLGEFVPANSGTNQRGA